MTQATDSGVRSRSESLPGSAIVARIRRLIIVALLAVAGYAFFTGGSKAFCPGGVTGDGAFLDAAGNTTSTAPTCISLTLGPSVLVYLAIAAVVIGALTRVLRHASDDVSAIRYLDRAAAVVAILVVASVVISQVWFSLIPITNWDGTGTFFFPFPFGSVTMDVGPMTTS